MIKFKKISKNTWEAISALTVCMLVILVIDRLTNRLDVLQGHAWDFVYYIDMAENGIRGNVNLASPYAYRVITPLLARFINQMFDFPTIVGFKVVGYFGLIMQLFGVYLLARHFNRNWKTGIVIMLLPAFGLFNTKFLLFDFYRPDHLGYAFLIFSMLALIKKQWIISLVLSLIGLNTREFLLIPPLIIIYENIRILRLSGFLWKPVLKVMGIIISIGIVLAFPRVLIPVKFTQQIVDPFNDPSFFNRFLGLLTNGRRNINYVFNLIAYLLPLWILSTPDRLKHAWLKSKKFHYWFVIYMGVTLGGMMVGGTDMMRYATYLFFPQAILLIFIIRDKPLHNFEYFYLFLAIILFNRIPFLFPIWDFSEYVNFYGGYGDWVNQRSVIRFVELAALIIIPNVLRLSLPWIKHPGLESKIQL